MRPVAPLALFTALALAACAHTRAPSTLTLRLAPRVDSNRGLAVYVLVRAVNAQRFATQDYRVVASLVETPDETVRATAVVFPGRQAQVVVPLRSGERLAVYGFFRTLGGRWRILLASPTPAQVQLRVGQDSLEMVPDGR